MPQRVFINDLRAQKMSFGENVKRLRRDKGWSQGELSQNCDIKPGHISKIENDKTDPSLSTVLKLVKALECTPNTLLIDSDGISLSGLMEATLERADKLDSESKRTLIDVIDHYCIAKGLQVLLKPSDEILGNMVLMQGDVEPVIKKK